jgi:hypothetical protein
MSAVLPLSPETRRRLRDASSLPKERSVPGIPLSPFEQEILSICLNAPEDPRDVGMLPAMLSAERRRGTPSGAADAPAA